VLNLDKAQNIEVTECDGMDAVNQRQKVGQKSRQSIGISTDKSEIDIGEQRILLELLKEIQGGWMARYAIGKKV
jgi:hypothetical protein